MSRGKAVVQRSQSSVPTSVDALALIPEESVWLAARKSLRTRAAYKSDVQQFMTYVGIGSVEELRRVDHRAVIAWERQMREDEGAQASTVRRRLAALSSLFTHLVQHNVVSLNPVKEVSRPAINRREGMTPAFSQEQARAILDAPSPETVQGLRDRAIFGSTEQRYKKFHRIY